ncbi:sulfotransferase family protein [Wenzhouxiangella sediminis]|uniref:Sulfotransferase n=1 Tax=Wenzhouxiangella sediminis TaxID=1792836 RepID=A0A3E1K5F6_9GAMM|nr:sulfotransferase [Wenzhouxiangella sediminis]RFF29245.1 sulfotransferase [Wenzhouxiangella sediminis]
MLTEERRPNLFLVGAQKSGTTTLARMLDNHPEVFMSSPKEPGYLAFGERGYTGIDGYGRLANPASWVIDSEAEYLALYRAAPRSARWLGDASTWYLSEPGSVDRVKAFNPGARIMVILRNPAERAYSAWCHARRDSEESCANFADALDLERQRNNPSHLLRYREMGQYATQVRRYFEAFGRGRVLVLFYEELRDEPEVLWSRCCDFLGLDSRHPIPSSYRQNLSGMPRSSVIHRLKRSERLRAALKKVVPIELARRANRALDALNLRRFPPLPVEQRESLMREFESEVTELMRLTGRDLTHWLPDR